MTWEQQWEAIRALDGDAKLCMRKPGDWFVDADMMICNEGHAYGVGDYGNGKSPQLAVEDHWQKLVAVQLPKYIYGQFRGERFRVVWNGYRWADVASQIGIPGHSDKDS